MGSVNQLCEDGCTDSFFGEDLLISIKSEHASSIYDGNKEYELRKTAPKRHPRRLFLYETGNVGAITGHVVISEIVQGEPKSVWSRICGSSISYKRFRQYYKNSNAACALRIAEYVRYKVPITLSELSKVSPGLRVPQNFLYLSNLPALHTYLFEKLLDESRVVDGMLRLERIQDADRGKFIQLVQKHISGSYLETGAQYARKLLEIDSSPFDREGVFTRRKRIFSIVYRGHRCGFLVITEKLGGSIKTGPVILERDYRKRGLGKRLRELIHKYMKKAGFRKVYATVPAKNHSAISYLTSSSYRLEAHLRHHYHDEHDELVLGYLLEETVSVDRANHRQLEATTHHQMLRSKSEDVFEFLQLEFSRAYCHVGPEWVQRQLAEAIRFLPKQGGGAFKTRRVYLASGFAGLLLVALVVFKRGGSVKIVVLTRTADRISISKFLEYLEQSLRKSRHQQVRKLYAHVPLFEHDMIASFYCRGYTVEGILEKPYNGYTDMLAFGKEVRF